MKTLKTTLTILSVIFTLSFFLSACPAKAGIISIYSNADSGTGTLRWGVEIANAAGGSNTINWIYGSGGSLTLLSNLAINGNTTLNATNSITDAEIAASTNAMFLGGAVTFHNDSISSTFSVHEDISGAGSLIKTGDGALVLTGDNSYAGGTYINGGILSIDYDSSLGASAGLLSFDGGTLKINADISSPRAITLNPGGGIFNTNSYTLSLSGIITGTGGFQKNGAGTLALGAANTYLGTTTINAGTLLLAADNALSAASTVTVAAGATLDLAGHTQTVAAITGAGTLALELQNGVTNLSVAGAADIAGSCLRVTYSPQIITAGQTFTPLTAATLTGQFSGIYSPAAVVFTPSYLSNSLVLTAALVPFTEISITANQRAVGAALEPLRSSPAGDIGTVLANLYTLEAEPLRSAFDQIGPVALTSLRGLAHSAARLRSAAIRARIEDLASGGARETFSTYSKSKSRLPDIEFEDDEPGWTRSSVLKEVARNNNPLSFFAAAGGISGKELREKKANGQSPGYELSGGALQTGADFAVTEHLSLGLTGGYSRGKAGVGYPSKAEISAAARHYGAYAAATAGELRLHLYAGRTKDAFKTERSIVFEGISRTAKGSLAAGEENLEAGLAYRFPATTPEGGFAPYLTLSSDRLKTELFTETGADALNLTVQPATARSLRASMGFRYFEAVENSGSVVKMSVAAAWARELKDSAMTLTSALAAGGAAFAVESAAAARDAINTTARISVEAGPMVSYYLEYSGEFKKRYRAHSGALGFSFRF
ncbi:MAG TPA: autotransporter domain-containing protein [Elusimicrobiales bacterium]|nr:autotransporter domain-containing protein [Elusimicrobiales bacterium]